MGSPLASTSGGGAAGAVAPFESAGGTPFCAAGSPLGTPPFPATLFISMAASPNLGKDSFNIMTRLLLHKGRHKERGSYVC